VKRARTTPDFHLYFIYWLATDELLCRLQTDHGLTIGERL
jgi:hypothetical protein